MNYNVNKPKHYTDGKIEVIDFIEDKNLDFHLGNAIKYISRAGKKDPEKELEDLQKAQWYLNRKIENISHGMIVELRVEKLCDHKYEAKEAIKSSFVAECMKCGFRL